MTRRSSGTMIQWPLEARGGRIRQDGDVPQLKRMLALIIWSTLWNFDWLLW